jgi:type I restriction enzyme S subunit
MPADWKNKKLGELLDVQNGFAFDSEFFSDSNGVPLIRIRDLKNGTSASVRYSGKYDNKFLVQNSDLLIGMDGEFRCYSWSGGEALLNQRVCRLINFGEEIEPEFIRFGINSHLKKIENTTPFVTVKHLSAKKIKEIDFSYPDRIEQRRIVARIKECMGRVDEIGCLRDEARCEARDIEFACFHDVLIEGIQQKGWSVRTLGDVAKSFRYGTSAKAHTKAKGLPVLRMGNLQGGYLDLSDLKYLDLTDGEAARFKLNVGDVLINRTNSLELVGKAATFDMEEGNWVYASYLVRVDVDREHVLPEFVTAVINSRMGREYVLKTARRAIGMVNLNAKEMAKFPMPLPPLSEQEIVVAQLRTARTLAEELRAALDEPDIGFLRQAVLQIAFAGDL